MSRAANRRRFAGQHILVTGGARGIGFEIAGEFAREGGRVHLFDVDAGLLSRAKELLSGQGLEVATSVVDVQRKAEVVAAVAGVQRSAPIDVLINNAGVARETPFLKIDETEWRSILDVNLTGMFFVAQAVAQSMAVRRQGAIVNMGSKNALFAEVGYAHYNASKGGVAMLSSTMALELAPLGVRVNCVCPGYIQTPMSQEIDSPDFVRDFVDRYIPLGRAGLVEDVAPLFLFLASDEARFITGQNFVVDGGQLAGQKAGPALLKVLTDAAG